MVVVWKLWCGVCCCVLGGFEVIFVVCVVVCGCRWVWF